MRFFTYGQDRVSPKVIIIALLSVAVMLIFEWGIFYYLKQEHRGEITKILCEVTKKDSQLLFFKMDRRINAIENIVQSDSFSLDHFFDDFEKLDGASSFSAEGWVNLDGSVEFAKSGVVFNPSFPSHYIQSVLNDQKTISFIKVNDQSVLSISRLILNEEKEKIGALVVFVEDTMFLSIPFDNQIASLLIDGAGKIVKDLTLSAEGYLVKENGFSIDKALFSALEKDFSSLKNDDQGGFVLKPRGTSDHFYAVYSSLGINDWSIVALFPSNVVEGHIGHFNFLFEILLLVSFLLLTGLIIYAYLLRRFYRFDLEKMVSYDRLTGALTKNKLFWLLKNSHKPTLGLNQAFIVSNIKNFGLFNTIFGRDASDSILQRSKILLEQKLQKNEWLARSFADRFYIVLFYSNESELISRLEEMAKDVVTHNEDIMGNYPIHFCFGVYKVPKDNKKDFAEMFDLADMALKRGTDAYSKKVSFYDQQIQNSIEKEMVIESRMEEALMRKEFLVYLQPKYDVISEQIVGAEALARWQTREELLLPDSFIPIFERDGFISKLDMYMLEEVCLIQRRRINEKKPCIPISVNQSRLLLYNASYVDALIDIVDKYEIPHHLIELEITESVVFEDKAVAIKIFHQLLKLGFKISMDDFGSGYSSLSMLREIEVSVIKIDRHFLEDFINSDKGKKIIVSILGLIRSLGLSSVAEGVETKEQLDFLREAGCHWVQGFYFSKPIPAEDFIRKFDGEN